MPAYRWYTDPQQRTARALGRGEPVTLLGDGGLPGWYRWRQDPAGLAELDDGSRVAAFRADRLSLLELCEDPQRTRYRLSAEIRQLDSPTRAGSVGVYVGFEPIDLPGGGRADRWCGVEYSDLQNRALTHRPTQRRIECLDCLAFARPDGVQDESRPGGGGWTAFYPAPNTAVRAPPWRRFVLTVGPDEVAVEWSSPDSPTPLPPLPAFRAAAGRGEGTKAHLSYLRLRWPDQTLPDGGWHPRRPLGVYARRATLAVRNVTIEPLPD